MPQARPSMVASVPVLSDRPSASDTAMIPAMLRPTPRIAVSSGSPAAAIDPKVISRTRAATAMPTTSAAPPAEGWVASASPPTSTVRPASRAPSMARSRWSLLASVRSAAPVLKLTVAYAVVPSRLTAFAWKGSTALATWVPSAASSTRCSMALLFSVAVTFSPLGATNTIRALAASAAEPGKRCSNRSNAFCDSMPGMVKPSSAAAGALEAAKPAAPSTATHNKVTNQRHRKATRPRR